MAGTCPDFHDQCVMVFLPLVSIDKHYAWLMSDFRLPHIAFGFGGHSMQLQGSCSSGTGSIAWLDQLEILMLLFAGGLGFKFGDEGSGHWIGLNY